MKIWVELHTIVYLVDTTVIVSSEPVSNFDGMRE